MQLAVAIVVSVSVCPLPPEQASVSATAAAAAAAAVLYADPHAWTVDAMLDRRLGFAAKGRPAITRGLEWDRNYTASEPASGRVSSGNGRRLLLS